MKKVLGVVGALLVLIALLAAAAYLIWVRNTEQHALQLNAEDVYGSEVPTRYLFEDVNVVDVEAGAILEGYYLLIDDGVISGVAAGPAPDSVKPRREVVAGEGRYVLPGLIDMHAHLNSGGLIGPDSMTSVVALEQFARYGVTTVYGLGGQGYNEQVTAEMMEGLRSRRLVGPRLFSTGNVLTAPGGYPIPFLSRVTGTPLEELNLPDLGIDVVTDTTDLDAKLRCKRALGMQGVKIMVESGLAGATEEPRLSTDLVAEICERSAELGLRTFAHVSRADDLEDAVAAGADVIAHVIADRKLTDAQALIERMRRDSVHMIPTLSVSRRFMSLSEPSLLDDPFLHRFSSARTIRSLENWPVRRMVLASLDFDPEEMLENSLYNFELLREAGIPMLMGADAGNPFVVPGYSSHQEMSLMAEAGMPNAEVLRAATIRAAQYLGIGEQTGSIEAGKEASFLMLDGNPLVDIEETRSIHRVMLEGYWVD